MLVRLTDQNGGDVWVNPVHVRYVQRGKKHTELVMGLGMGWSGVWSLKVQEAPDVVSEALNAGMPALSLYVPDDQEEAAARAAAAAAVATSG